MPAPADYLALSDAELLRQCDVDIYRGSGPGGQKRNKTSNAVRLRHEPTGLVVTATETRSQHENRVRALRRLRECIALNLRRPVDLATYVPPPLVELLFVAGRLSPRHPDHARAVQLLLDLFVAAECSVSDAAARLDVSTGALSRVLLADASLHRTVNDLRIARGMRPLR